MRSPRIGILALLFVSVVACRRPAPPAMHVWATAPAAYTPQSGSSNAFDAYALAAKDVEAKAGDLLDRVSFTPGQKTRVRGICEGAVRDVAAASRGTSEFRYVPRVPFSAAPFQRGWRLIGRSLRWQAEEAAAKGDYDRAIDAVLVATRFGFDLTGGGATDASLGFAIADEARLALTPHLDRMGAGQLGRLAKGLTEALQRKPSVAVVVENERQASRLAVQTLQDAYANRRLEEFEKQLGLGIREAVQYLRDQELEDARRYFEGYAAEAEAETDTLERRAKLPAALREKEPKTKLAAERPWRRFARHFVATARPLLDIDDRTTVRTRLLGLTASMLQRRKLKQAYPRNLDRLPSELTVDPFTGGPIRYVSDGVDFRVYSVGANLRDDGGDTDDAWLAPDLTLERREGM
ncbi:MAG: hypothetical protein ACO1SV_09330 [Fimbriimonas sp.]